MPEYWGVALATFFATIGPVDVAAMFAALTASASPAQRRSIAIRGCVIAALILLVFALLGKQVLAGLGISLAALRTAGGILLPAAGHAVATPARGDRDPRGRPGVRRVAVRARGAVPVRRYREQRAARLSPSP
jgi:small neutral amino acid transporter SnatA (MarC family)